MDNYTYIIFGDDDDADADDDDDALKDETGVVDERTL